MGKAKVCIEIDLHKHQLETEQVLDMGDSQIFALCMYTFVTKFTKPGVAIVPKLRKFMTYLWLLWTRGPISMRQLV